MVTFRADEYDIGALTHECVHAAWWVLEIVGVTVDVNNQEPLAYLTDWLSMQIDPFMVSHRQEIKTRVTATINL